MYHDLRKEGSFASWLRVEQRNFKRQINFLRKIAQFIAPHGIFEPAKSKGTKLRILLSFDDGQVNNFELAFPILKEHQIPALFFISTNNVMSGNLFWFDRIIIPIQTNQISRLDLGQFGLGSYFFREKNERKRWDDIQKVLVDIKGKYRSTQGQVEQMANVLHYFDQLHEKDINRYVQECRPLTTSEIREMSTHNECYFGSHSHHHEILTYLNDYELKTNIERSKTFLEELTGREIKHISYPNGDYDDRVIRYCQEGGFQYGYTIMPTLVNRLTHPMKIPRIGVSGFDTSLTIFIKIIKAIILSNRKRCV